MTLHKSKKRKKSITERNLERLLAIRKEESEKRGSTEETL